jgi:hypothetical protein
VALDSWGGWGAGHSAALLFALAVVLAAAGPACGDDRPPAALADHAAACFAAGVAERGDAAAARPHFRASAAAYTSLWEAGFRNPAVGLNRARARRLAGDLPGAIAALHEALALARYDRTLQVELEDARAAVAYPLTSDLAGQCRPAPVRTVGSRMSAADAFLLAGFFALAAGLAAARFAMTRTPGWLGAGGLALAALAVLGGLWWQDDHDRTRRDTLPLVVVADDVALRRGNAESYPPRFEPKLPRGVEARVLARRGGWVQVELAGGAAGWLPEPAALPAPGR